MLISKTTCSFQQMTCRFPKLLVEFNKSLIDLENCTSFLKTTCDLLNSTCEIDLLKLLARHTEDSFFCGDGWVWRPYPTLYRGLES